MTRRIHPREIDTAGAAPGDSLVVDETGTLVPSPAAARLTVQDENTAVDTAVEVIDFQGEGVTVTAGAAGEVLVTIPGGAAGSFVENGGGVPMLAAGPEPVAPPDGTWWYDEAADPPVVASSGEVLMADGVTPPEPLTTEDEDDWLYEG